MSLKKLLSIIGVYLILFAAAPTFAATAEKTAKAGETLELSWEDLVPEDEGLKAEMKTLGDLGIVNHNSMERMFEQEESSGIVTKFNGQKIELPGFIVPIQFDEQKVTAFLLAPYVGACIHVPPPPANQMVFVQTEEGIVVEDLYMPIFATGTLTASSVRTDYADAGYSLKLESTRPYEW